MFKVTITDEFEEKIVLSAADAVELLAVIKEYTSDESLDSSAPIYSILAELDEEYYNNRGFYMG